MLQTGTVQPEMPLTGTGLTGTGPFGMWPLGMRQLGTVRAGRGSVAVGEVAQFGDRRGDGVQGGDDACLAVHHPADEA